MFLRNVRKRLANLLVIHNGGDFRDLELDYGFVQGHLLHLFLNLHGLDLPVWNAPLLKLGLYSLVLLSTLLEVNGVVITWHLPLHQS